MYARIVNMKLKKDAQSEFTKTFETTVLPMLRKQDGFRDEISLLAPERSEVTGISFWNKKENADDYNRTTYQDVIKSLSRVIEGTPDVKAFEVSNSTFHKIAAGQVV
jgi:heme-degrading monooxygenase HmoA